MDSDLRQEDLAGDAPGQPRRMVRLKRLSELNPNSKPAMSFAPLGDKHPPEHMDLNAALDLVCRAAETIQQLQRRSDDVEAFAREVVERTRDELGAIQRQIDDFRQRALDSEAHAKDVEARLAEAERRAEVAEDRARIAGQWLVRFQEEIFNRLAGPCEALQFLETASDAEQPEL